MVTSNSWSLTFRNQIGYSVQSNPFSSRQWLTLDITLRLSSPTNPDSLVPKTQIPWYLKPNDKLVNEIIGGVFTQFVALAIIAYLPTTQRTCRECNSTSARDWIGRVQERPSAGSIGGGLRRWGTLHHLPRAISYERRNQTFAECAMHSTPITLMTGFACAPQKVDAPIVADAYFRYYTPMIKINQD